MRHRTSRDTRETGQETGERRREVVPILKGFNLDASRLLAWQGTLSLLDLVLELAHGMEAGADIGSCLLLVLLDEVVDDAVIEVGHVHHKRELCSSPQRWV